MIDCVRCGYKLVSPRGKCPECGLDVLRSRAMRRYWEGLADRVLGNALLSLCSLFMFGLHESGILHYWLGTVAMAAAVVILVIGAARVLSWIARTRSLPAAHLALVGSLLAAAVVVSVGLSVLGFSGAGHVPPRLIETIGLGEWGAVLGVFWTLMGVALCRITWQSASVHAGILALGWLIATGLFVPLVWRHFPDVTGVSATEFWTGCMGLTAVIIYTVVLSVALQWRRW